MDTVKLIEGGTYAAQINDSANPTNADVKATSISQISRLAVHAPRGSAGVAVGARQQAILRECASMSSSPAS